MIDIALQLTARQWATIDATMDNVAQDAQDSYEDPEPAGAIREAGRQQVPWVGRDRRWPPMDPARARSPAQSLQCFPPSS